MYTLIVASVIANYKVFQFNVGLAGVRRTMSVIDVLFELHSTIQHIIL